ncbi:MAG: hypothetical protein ACK559_03085, partial [bacterium]
ADHEPHVRSGTSIAPKSTSPTGNSLRFGVSPSGKPTKVASGPGSTVGFSHTKNGPPSSAGEALFSPDIHQGKNAVSGMPP